MGEDKIIYCHNINSESCGIFGKQRSGTGVYKERFSIMGKMYRQAMLTA
jgi:hypothetical protein